MLVPGFFDRDVTAVARSLIGALLVIEDIGGIIVETEAYDAQDPASHSFRGQTLRNAPMYGPPGCAYVYRSYGLHWCLNFTCGDGSAVLIRALEPRQGIVVMEERRGMTDRRLLCAGPGRLCQALEVTDALNGALLDRAPFHLTPPRETAEPLAGPRIGISKGAETPWRFGLAGSRYLSRPFAK